ncbi:MAG TPA: hypothetical protein VFE14_19900 [Micromonosporaceae bacterium]|jgi:hypothetical protein|nr:hypothetical protein [Micromonosporaceae bacterium]
MRRVSLFAVPLLLVLVGCSGGGARSVSHTVSYELNMVGPVAFANITASYTDAQGHQVKTTMFGASWSLQVTVAYPKVKSVDLAGSFTPDPAEPNPGQSAQLRCTISIDGKMAERHTDYVPVCRTSLAGR